jgi:peptidoglycan/xylan/chitin deacetylase (PgdA/CDA1 family)
MQPSVRTVRRGVIHALQRAGIDRAIGSSRWRRQRLLILAYHGISLADEHEWNGALYMSPALFEGRLQLLRSVGCSVLPLGEALERLYRGDLEERSVAITFDDGYFDFVVRAYPLLEAYDIPVTLYLRTNALGTMPVLRLICSYMFWKARRGQVRITELRAEPFDISTRQARIEAVSTVAGDANRLEFTGDREGELVRAIASHLSLDVDALLQSRICQLMSEEDVRRLSSAGVDFQLHTHSHYTPRDRQRFKRVIQTNRELIEALTGKPTSHFCYPSGNYDALFLPWLRDLGVRSATTCDPGLASSATDPLMLPRFVDTSSTTAEEFLSWLTGTFAWLSRRRSYAQRTA